MNPNDKIYEHLKVLGSGSQGHTSLAKHRASGRLVAIKSLHMHQVKDWKGVELFEREANVLKALDHPHIPAHIDAWVDDSQGDVRHYLAQEYIPGRNLWEHLKQNGRLDEDEAAVLLTQILRALEYIHTRVPPIVHRDIKPSNIQRSDDGTYHLIDFGSVQNIIQSELGGSTLAGTPGYIPPEQAAGLACEASDLYALGVTVCVALTGKKPEHVTLSPDAKLEYAPLLPPGQLGAVLEHMIEPLQINRPTRARDLLDILEGKTPLATLSPTEFSSNHKLTTEEQVAGMRAWNRRTEETVGQKLDAIHLTVLEQTPALPPHHLPYGEENDTWLPMGSVRAHLFPITESSHYYKSQDGLIIFEKKSSLPLSSDRLLTFFTDGTALSTGHLLDEEESIQGDLNTSLGSDDSSNLVFMESLHRKKLATLMAEGKRPIPVQIVEHAYMWSSALHNSAFYKGNSLNLRRIGAGALYISTILLIPNMLYQSYKSRQLTSEKKSASFQQVRTTLQPLSTTILNHDEQNSNTVLSFTTHTNEHTHNQQVEHNQQARK